MGTCFLSLCAKSITCYTFYAKSIADTPHKDLHMAHIIKFKSSAMGQIFAHINRDRSTVSKYSNADIDLSRTPQNFELHHGDMEILQKKLQEVSHTHRKDLVVCCGVAITLPNELKNAKIERQKDFFTECHKFLEAKFGAKNSVYSVVHFDETTPHLHYGFIPVIEKERKCRSKAKAGQTYTQRRICAKEVITKDLLKSFHDELQEHISKTFPEVRLVAEDKQARMKQSKSIAELKEETKKRMESKEKQLDQVCWEAKIWKHVAEGLKDEAKAVKDKAEQTAKQEAKEKAKKLAEAEAQKHIKQAQEAIESLRNLADTLAKRKFEKKTGLFGIRLSADEYADLYSKASIDTELKEAKETLNALSGKHLQDLEKANKDLNSQNEALKSENKRLNEQNQKAQIDIAEAKEQAENAQSERDHAEAKLSRLEKANKDLTLENSFLKRTLTGVWQKIENVLSEPVKQALIKLGIGKARSQGRSL